MVCGVANQLASLALHPSLLLCKPKDNSTVVVLDISYYVLYPIYQQFASRMIDSEPKMI